MKKNNLITIISILIISIFAPIIILYLLEDNNVDYLNNVSLHQMQEREKNDFDSAIIETIYRKYNETKYSVSTFDEYEYAVVNKMIEGKNYVNENLAKLKELENIGLLKNDFFSFLAEHINIITRTNRFYGENLNYSNKRLFLPSDGFKNAFMSFEIDNLSGKIIGLKIPKEYIITQEDILKSYIHYLDLTSEDWIYEKNSIFSQNKKIEIKIENINNIFSLSIIPYS